MLNALKLIIFLIFVLVIFNKQVVSYSSLYFFSKLIERKVEVDNIEINYSKNQIIVNNLKILNPKEFDYANIVEAKELTLNYDLKSLFSDLIIINSIFVEDIYFFIEIIKKDSEQLSPEKKQKMYVDNIDAVEKIIKHKHPKIWPKKKKDKNFLILDFEMNNTQAYIKTSFLTSPSVVKLADIKYSRVGNGGENYLHHKIALKEIASRIIDEISNLELKNFIKKIYNYKNIYIY